MGLVKKSVSRGSVLMVACGAFTCCHGCWRLALSLGNPSQDDSQFKSVVNVSAQPRNPGKDTL